MSKIALVTFLLALTLNCFGHELVIGITPANGAPYVVGDLANINEGIIHQISQELTHETKITFRFMVLPRARIERYLLDGRIDIITFFNPSWTANREQYLFSEPTFTESNLVITLAGSAFQPSQWSDLEGPIGTHRGYVYPAAFNEAVDNGTVFRDDVDVPRQNYMKLQANRINGFVLSDIIYAYDLKENPELSANTKASEWRLTENSIHWLMLKNHADADKIITAVNRLIASGIVESILEKYR